MHTQLCTDIMLVFDIFKSKRQCKHPSQSPFGGKVAGKLMDNISIIIFHFSPYLHPPSHPTFFSPVVNILIPTPPRGRPELD